MNKVILKFRKEFGENWFGNDLALPDLHQPRVKSNEVETFILKALSEQSLEYDKQYMKREEKLLEALKEKQKIINKLNE